MQTKVCHFRSDYEWHNYHIKGFKTWVLIQNIIYGINTLFTWFYYQQYSFTWFYHVRQWRNPEWCRRNQLVPNDNKTKCESRLYFPGCILRDNKLWTSVHCVNTLTRMGPLGTPLGIADALRFISLHNHLINAGQSQQIIAKKYIFQ